MLVLEVTISIHGKPCIEILDSTPGSTPEIREIIRNAVTRILPTKHSLYEVHYNAQPFLQGDDGNWMLVEFWQKDYQPFVDYLNEQIARLKTPR